MPLDLPSDTESASLEFSLDALNGQRRHSLLTGPHRPDFLRDEILADLLEATVRRIPDKTALVDGTQSLTYAELDDAASLAASRLIEAGVGPGQIVGLWLPRGVNLLVMQAAIAKTGAGCRSMPTRH